VLITPGQKPPSQPAIITAGKKVMKGIPVPVRSIVRHRTTARSVGARAAAYRTPDDQPTTGQSRGRAPIAKLPRYRGLSSTTAPRNVLKMTNATYTPNPGA
jgi:hypothetical protein